MFTEEDEVGVYYPHCDILVVRAVVARNRLARMLVDDRSAVNILFGSAFDQIEVVHNLTTISEPLFGFTGYSLIPQGMIAFWRAPVPCEKVHGILGGRHLLYILRSPRHAHV
ncbi:Uncharacterized protein Adt_38243 [Abeliophyllum distichum]|uniref:Uncharacterized protein n=1 Tax=Abeliophyllum distichum TaxID=126358 RepID=A0ABD1Q2N5_9LAMI